MDEFEHGKEYKEKRQMTLTTLSVKVRYIIKKKNKSFIKNYQLGIFSFVFDIKLGGPMTEIFSVVL